METILLYPSRNPGNNILKPVSYTHLDVYKRQTKKGTKREGLGITISGSVSAETPFMLPKRQKTFVQGENGVFDSTNGYSLSLIHISHPKVDAPINEGSPFALV